MRDGGRDCLSSVKKNGVTQKPESFYIQEALERSLEDIEDTCLADLLNCEAERS